MKITDEQLSESYKTLNSVWKVGKKFGVSGQLIHNRLKSLGLNKPKNVFTEEDSQILKLQYLAYREMGKLDELASKMGRTKHFICRQAKALGLTSASHRRPYLAKWSHLTEDQARVFLEQFSASSLGLHKFCKKNGYGTVPFWQTMTKFFPAEYEALIELKAPKSGRYRLGRSFEYRIRDDLKRRGYFVMRSPASRSPIDLVGIKKDSPVVFVQCKRGGVISVKEWNSVFDLSLSVGATPLLAETNPEGARGWIYWLLTDRKDGSKKAQPRIMFQP